MNFLTNNLWAISPDYIERLTAMLSKDIELIAKEAKAGTTYSKAETVALLSLNGTIFQKENVWTQYGYGTSTETFQRWFDSALADNSVSRIVIDVNSPGGSVYGVKELSDHIYNNRGIKPIVAVANSVMCSAAYHIGSAADRVYATVGGDVGSVGVYAIHTDVSEFETKAGIKTTIIAKPSQKILGNSFEPLSEEAKAYIQKSVDDSYEMFVSTVARNRGTTKSNVINNYGSGKTLIAKDALEAGMIDGIKTLEQVLDIKKFKSLSKSKAQAELTVLKCKAL